MSNRAKSHSLKGIQIPRSRIIDAVREDARYCREAHTPECWFAAVVAPQSEREAVRQLIERGYEAFITSELRYRRASQHSKRKQGVEYPLIPGLVFVGVESYGALSLIWVMDIIKGFLGSGPHSSRLRTKDLERLREMTVDAAAAPEAREMISREEYTIGELCEVVSGPLTGQHLTVRDIGGGGKKPYYALVTSPFFNDAGLLKLPLDWFRPV